MTSLGPEPMGCEGGDDLGAVRLEPHVDERHLTAVVAEDEPVDEVAQQADAPHPGSERDDELWRPSEPPGQL